MWGRGTWAWGLGLLIPLVGCSPNTNSVGSSSAASIGGDGSSDSGAPSTSADAEDGPGSTSVGDGTGTGQGTLDDGPMTSPTGADDATSGDPSTTSEGGAALLTLSDVPLFDYGNLAPGGQTTHSFTVTNEGEAEATGLAGSIVMGPFSVSGGTCGASLTTNTSCTIDVRFSPADLGPFQGALSVTYDGGDVACDLQGAGTGQSGNLIQNPGGETLGNPPPSWSDVGAGGWAATGFDGYTPLWAGAGYLAAQGGPNSQNYILRQDVDVSQWSGLTDAGLLRLSFQGEACSLDWNNDSYRIRVQFRDAGGTVLATYDTDWSGNPNVQMYADDRVAPSNTRTVRVDLFCNKSGGTVCNAYYDELDLRASYP